MKKVAEDIGPDYPDLKALIANMTETMHKADGVGIAAPQIGLAIRLFIVDTSDIERKDTTNDPGDQPFKQVFINAQKVEESDDAWAYEEGCLSIPKIRGDVERPKSILIRWVDENFEAHERLFTGINARVIQHEYDHIEGILFVEKLKPLKKQLIRRRLEDIRVGKIGTEYKMKFYNVR